MRRLPRSARIATGIAALAVTALVPLCGVAQAAAPTPTSASTETSAPTPSGEDQQGRTQNDNRLVKLGDREGALGLGVLGIL